MQYRINKSFILLHYLKSFILLYFYIKFFQNSENTEKVYNCDTSETWERNDKEREIYPEKMETIYSNFAGGVKGLARYGDNKLVVVGGGDTCKGFIKILDISDVNNIHQVATQIISDYMDRDSGLENGRPRNVSLIGDFAFVAIHGSGLMVVDLSQMDNYSNNYCRVGYYKESDIDDVRVYKRKKPETEEDQIIAVLLVNYYGIKILNVTNPGLLQTASECTSTTSPCWNVKKQVEQGYYPLGTRSHLTSLEVVTDYWVDIDNDRRKGEEEDLDEDDINSAMEKIDLAFFSIPSTGKLYIINISKLNGDRVPYYGEIALSDPTGLGDIYLDKENRTLYVNDVSEGLIVVDMHLTNKTSIGEGSGDRVTSIIPTQFNAKFGLTVDTDLNIAYVGELDKGVNAIKLGNPKIKLVYLNNQGKYQEVTVIAPSGVNIEDIPIHPQTGEPYPNMIYVMAFVPGGVGKTIKANIWSQNPEGVPIFDWDDNIKSAEMVTLTRLSDDRSKQEYNMFLSEAVTITVKPDETISGKKLMSGEWIQANFDFNDPENIQKLSYMTPQELRQTIDRKPSLASEFIDSDKPNPANNPSTGMGELTHIAPGLGGPSLSSVYLHSGEFFIDEIDMMVPGRGFDFVFKRHYESQSIYSGVLGWGWDHNLNRRLVELYKGDVLYFDGSGRRERYKAIKQGEMITGYESPKGYFTTLKKRVDGSFLIKGPQGFMEMFNSLGRIIRLQDPHGNKMFFYYNLEGKLSAVVDTLGRTFLFNYYPYVTGDKKSNRLKSITDFNNKSVYYDYDEKGELIRVRFGERSRVYEYETVTGSVKRSHNLKSITDAKNQKYLTVTYTSDDTVNPLTIGNDTVSITAGETATTVDGRGISRTYTHVNDHIHTVTEGGEAIATYEYNDDGLMTSISRPMGNKTLYEYDTNNPSTRSRGNLRFVRDFPGSGGGDTLITEYRYTPEVNRVNYIKDPKGLETYFTVNGRNGNIDAIKYPDTTSFQYVYNDYGQVKQIIDPYEKVTEYVYYPEGTPVAAGFLQGITVDKGGDNIKQEFEYNKSGLLSVIRNGEGVETHYTNYNNFNEVQTIIEGATASTDGQPKVDYTTTLTYDANGNIQTVTRSGITTTYNHDIRNRVQSIVKTGGEITHTIGFTYDPSGNLREFTDAKGFKDTYTYYNNRNLLYQKSLGNGLTTFTYQYNANGQLYIFKDGENKPYTYHYDGHGRLLEIVDPLQDKVRYGFDSNSNIASVEGIDKNNSTLLKVVYEYNNVNQMTHQKVEKSDGFNVTEFGYTDAGFLASIKNPNQHTYTIEPTGSGLPHILKDPLENQVLNIYDRRGLLKTATETETGGRTLNSTFTYDVLGKPGIQNDDLSRKYEAIYNKKQQLEQTADPEGGAVSYKYDGIGRLVKVIRHVIYGEETNHYETVYAYDNNNNLVSITDAKQNTTIFGYDTRDRLTSITYPGGLSTSVAYNGNDQIQTSADLNGTELTNTYDDAGRLTERVITRAAGVEGTSYEKFTYDGLGRVLTVENNHSIVEFVYNKEGQIEHEIQKQIEKNEEDVVITSNYDVSSQYDSNGNKISLIYPSGKTLTITPDELDRISTIKEGERLIVSYNYSDQHGVQTINSEDSVTMEVTPDAGKRQEKIVYKKTATNEELYSRDLEWTKTDLKSSKKNKEGEGKNYQYDTAKRLRKENDTENNRDIEYDIDGVENVTEKRETRKDITETTGAEYNNRNQLVRLNGTALTYDNNGNLKSYKDQYTYDWKNQLVKVETEDGKTIGYKYDGLGRRIQKKVIDTETTITNYVYDGWRVIEERDGNGELIARNVYSNGIDERVEVEIKHSPLTSYIPLHDSIGSAVAMTDTNGNIVERMIYSTYGKPTFIYDNESPQVDVVRTESGDIVIRFSEPVDKEKAENSFTVKRGTDTLSGTFTFADDDKLLKFIPSNGLPQNETLTITVTPELEDRFGNKLSNEFIENFTYTGSDLNIYDRVPPEVFAVKLISGEFYVEFSEEMNIASVSNSIELSSTQGVFTGTTTHVDGKTLKFVPFNTLSNNVEYTVKVKTFIQDLSGKNISEDFSKSFINIGEDLIIYEKPDSSKHKESSIKNNYLFHGRTFEPESDLYYYRARYLLPELGRFLQGDPNVYEDSLNLYQSFNQNPVNFVDPMGTIIYFTGEDPENDFKEFLKIFENIGHKNIRKYLKLEKDKSGKYYVDLVGGEGTLNRLGWDILHPDKSKIYTDYRGRGYYLWVNYFTKHLKDYEFIRFWKKDLIAGLSLYKITPIYEFYLEELFEFMILDRELTTIEFRTGSEFKKYGKIKYVNKFSYGGGVTVEPFETESGNIEIVVNPKSKADYLLYPIPTGGDLSLDIHTIIVHEFGHAFANMLGFVGEGRSDPIFWELAVMMENLFRLRKGQYWLRPRHDPEYYLGVSKENIWKKKIYRWEIFK